MPLGGTVRSPPGPVSILGGFNHEERIGVGFSERHEQGEQRDKARIVVRSGWPAYCLHKESIPYHRRIYPTGTLVDTSGIQAVDAPVPALGARGGVGARGPLDGMLAIAPIWPGLATNTVFWSIVAFASLRACRCVRRMLKRVLSRTPGICEHCGYPSGSSALCTECGAPRKSA
jgi:hypothetical protein